MTGQPTLHQGMPVLHDGTPLALARARGFDAMVRLLEAAGAK